MMPPSQPETKKSGRDGHAIEKSVNGQSQQRGNSGVVRRKMLDVSFLSEVKMRRKSMFKKMNQEISHQHQEVGKIPREGHRLGKDFQDGGRQHEAGAQREKIVQVLARPVPPEDEQPAKNIGRRRGQTEQQRRNHARSGSIDVAGASILTRCDGTE